MTDDPLAQLYDHLTETIEEVLRADPKFTSSTEDPVMVLDYATVVFGRSLTDADNRQSTYSIILKDGGHHTPVHHIQGLAQRLWNFANQDDNPDD